MKKAVELSENDLELVAGGEYAINNQHRLFFSTCSDKFDLKCSDYAAMEVMDALKGKYATQEEYDQACITALKAKQYI